MVSRAAFPIDVMTISPGYPWQLALDIKFEDQRPSDWPSWQVRMHVFSEKFSGFTLSVGDGVEFEAIAGLPGETGEVTIPVIRMSGDISETLRDVSPLQYVIDLRPPDGEVEDYFAGNLGKAFSPPAVRL